MEISILKHLWTLLNLILEDDRLVFAEEVHYSKEFPARVHECLNCRISPWSKHLPQVCLWHVSWRDVVTIRLCAKLRIYGQCHLCYLYEVVEWIIPILNPCPIIIYLHKPLQSYLPDTNCHTPGLHRVAL